MVAEKEKQEVKVAQKVEALLRMKHFHMHEKTIKEFEKGIVNCSVCGILYWLSDEQKELVAEWEERTGNLVYHVIHNDTEFGELLAFLYVSKEVEEWEYDAEDLKNNIQLAYVKNLTDDTCSEYGSIGVTPVFGGIVRTF